jgi:hypothetical protein
MANLYFNTSKNPENYRFQEKFQESDYTLTLLKMDSNRPQPDPNPETSHTTSFECVH